jgi:hypothetical protein
VDKSNTWRNHEWLEHSFWTISKKNPKTKILTMIIWN